MNHNQISVAFAWLLGGMFCLMFFGALIYLYTFHYLLGLAVSLLFASGLVWMVNDTALAPVEH